MKMELEKNPLVQTVFEALDVIKSQKPFQIIFYGSRQRGDFSEISDYNFYLIASPQDQIKSSFIQATTKALDQLGVEIPVSLIAGDYDSFKMRMRFFEPTSIHICELGNTFYGTGDFETITDDWRNQKLRKNPDLSKLKQYIENRLKFFKNLKAKNPKDEISRLERVLALQIQFWVISNIHDVSIYELISLDIPVRVKPLIENLYKREVTDEVRNLLTLYDQIHGLKKIVKFSMPGQTGSVEPAIKSRNVRAETEIK